MDKKQELLDAIMNDTEYDFISNNYYYFSKEQLRDIVKEYMYAVSLTNNDSIISCEIPDTVVEQLKELL